MKPTTNLFVDLHEGESETRIVLIHGAMDRHTSFARVRKLLSTYTTIAYDRRGYARSLDVGPATSLQDHVDDLLEIVGAKPAVIVGHSYGGVVGLCLASQKPDLARGLVVYEAPMPWTDWWPTSAGGSTIAAGADEGPEAAAESFMRRIVGDRVWAMLGDETRAARRAEGRALLVDLVGLRMGSCPYDTAKITCRVAIGFGAKSHPHQQRSARELAALFSDRADPVIPVEFPASSHNAHAATPDAFADLIRSVL
jgi:pimeloyl-ACP methyl ester carboxylesterase